LVLSGAALLWASWPSYSAASDHAVRNLSVLTAAEMQQPLAACPIGVTTGPWPYCNAGTTPTGCLTTFTGFGTICTGCATGVTGTMCRPINGTTSTGRGTSTVGSFSCGQNYATTPCVSSLCGCGYCCGFGVTTLTPCGNYNTVTGTVGGC
jgi:hypothetical protein